MGKKVKTGKSRQDKFYKLAKETGYRSRAAFKLIQLNRKFGFLQNARVCVDLCAAPGGWLQVAHQNMPLSSLIIGVDLVPIKQVGTCVTFAEDIKSDKCRQLIKKELKTWEADVFLHDGAPNVGKNWIFDAYQQNELTLFSLKLATEFMRKGAWFVTKVFRSKDYHALMWLFKKLFKKVFATKPQASRHESAEIFIVCEGYLKPDKIDPRLLDPKHIFKEMEKEVDTSWEKGNQVSQLFKVIEKAKKKAEGYEDDATVIFKKVSVKDYLANETFAELLANYNEIDIDDEECLTHEATTEEVKACCKDLRVLGRKDLKLLITWRKRLIKHFEDKKKAEGGDGEEAEEEMEVDGVEKDGDEAKEDDDEEEEEDDLEKAIKATAETEKKDEKKKKKKEAKKKQKLRERIAMKMVHVGDKFDETRDDEMFDLKRISMGSKGLKRVVGEDQDEKRAANVEMPEVEESEESEDEEPLPMKKKVVSFKKSDDDDDGEEAPTLVDAKNLGYMGEKIANETVDSDEEELSDDMEHDSDVDVGEDDDDDDEGEDDDDNDDDVDDANPLIESLTGDKNKEDRLKRKTSVWFAKDVFNDVEGDDDDDDYEALRVQQERRKRKKAEKTEETASVGAKLGSDGEEKKEEEEEEDTSDSDSDSEDEEIKKKIVTEEGEKRRGGDGFEVVPAKDVAAKGSSTTPKLTKAQMLDPEGLAIASYIIQSRKHRREIEESGYNRWTNNDKHLPDWFVKDEKTHWRNRAPVQITKQMVEEYKKRQMEINARPIKKVAEAKARKKKKALKQLEKVKKKAEAVVEKEGMGEKEKAMEIRKMYKKALNRKKTETKLVVSKKGGKGVKGSKPAKGTKYKVVDARLKKDKRAAEKKAGKKGGAKKGGGGGGKKSKTGGAKGGRPGKR